MTDVSADGAESDHGSAETCPEQNLENRFEISCSEVGCSQSLSASSFCSAGQSRDSSAPFEGAHRLFDPDAIAI